MIALAHDIQEELRATHKLDISTESIELILLCAERLKRAIDYNNNCNAVVETKKVNDKDSTEGVGLVGDAPVLASTDGPVKCRQCGNTVWRVAADRLGTVCVWCSENGKDRTEGVGSVSLSTGGIDCPRNAAGHPTGPAGITGVIRPAPGPNGKDGTEGVGLVQRWVEASTFELAPSLGAAAVRCPKCGGTRWRFDRRYGAETECVSCADAAATATAGEPLDPTEVRAQLKCLAAEIVALKTRTNRTERSLTRLEWPAVEASHEAFAERLRKFVRENSADTSTIWCPCGQSFTWSGVDKDLRPWVELHVAHTAETIGRKV